MEPDGLDATFRSGVILYSGPKEATMQYESVMAWRESNRVLGAIIGVFLLHAASHLGRLDCDRICTPSRIRLGCNDEMHGAWIVVNRGERVVHESNAGCVSFCLGCFDEEHLLYRIPRTIVLV